MTPPGWQNTWGIPTFGKGCCSQLMSSDTTTVCCLDGEPDRIMAVVDTAWGGGDSLSMPVAYIYGEDVYIQDVVFNAGDKTATRPLVLGTLKQHHPHMVRRESNNGEDEHGAS